MSEDLKEKLGELVHYYGISGQKWLPIIKELKELTEREAKLVEAIQKTINDNLHLADGEDCTLRELTRVLEELNLLGE